MAELLTVLMEGFEEKAYAFKPARPMEVLREWINSNGLRQRDLLDIFRTPSIVSEVLREKRGLTVKHIRKLSQSFMYRRKCSLRGAFRRPRICP
jgi:HTH-type transcriptional regulator/antitoxin HigA